ncbi:MAG TPA: hypothetical protein VNL14_14870 [Candidatus Acidoferrales bacterium]|nr:hypothetical protein [Candidatus Acidoferrales bacterium]
MADTVKRVPYFYVEVPDKPGEGARVLNLFRQENVNLLAFSGFPQGRRAQLDFVPADPAAFRAAARKSKLKLVGPKTVFLIQGDDRVGAGAEILEKLAEAKINVISLQAVSAGSGLYGALLWVEPRSVNKAAQILGAS